jgi:hypothetical protein
MAQFEALASTHLEGMSKDTSNLSQDSQYHGHGRGVAQDYIQYY